MKAATERTVEDSAIRQQCKPLRLPMIAATVSCSWRNRR